MGFKYIYIYCTAAIISDKDVDVGTASFIHSDLQPTHTNRPPPKSVVAALQDVTLHFLFAVTDYVLT